MQGFAVIGDQFDLLTLKSWLVSRLQFPRGEVLGGPLVDALFTGGILPYQKYRIVRAGARPQRGIKRWSKP